MFLARFSIKNPVLINLIMLTVLVVGVYSFMSLPRAAIPEFSFNWAFVITVYPGTASAEIEQLITKPIEEEIEDIEKIDLIDSTSSEGVSVISVKFEQNISNDEFDKRYQDLRAAVDKVKLPDAAEDPEIMSISSSHMFPMLNVVVSGDLPEKKLKEIADDLESAIQEINDVGTITVAGVREREIWVEVDQDQMDSLNLTFPQIVAALSMQNVNIPGGTIKAGRSEYILRTLGQFRDTEEIKNVIVHSYPSGNQLHLQDVATISDTYEEEETRARLNGRQAVTLSVTRKSGGNVISIVEEIKELLEEYRVEKLPDGAHINTTIDMSIFTKDSLKKLQSNAIFGIIFVLIALGIFLGRRNAFFVALGMPVTFMATFIFMKATGRSLNGTSLFGLVLVLGMVVDHAIVITENIYRHMQMGKSVNRAVMDGMREVTAPVLSATATTIAAFLPLMLMPGIIGAFLKVVPIVVTMALIASLVEALIILPSHIAEWTHPKNGKSKKEKKRKRWQIWGRQNGMENGKWFKKMVNIYTRVLKSILRRRYWAVGGVLLCVVIGASLIPLVGVNMYGEDDLGFFYVRIWMPPGTKLAETDRVLQQVERVAMTLPEHELEAVVVNAGVVEEEDGVTVNSNVGQLLIDLVEAKDRERGVNEVVADLRARCQAIAGYDRIEFTNIDSGPPTGKAVEVKVKGKRFDQLEAISGELQGVLAEIPGVYDIGDNFSQGKEELRVRLDKERARLHGLDVMQVAGIVRTAVYGATATVYRDGDEEVDVVVKFGNASEMSIEDIESMKLATPMGTRIPLREVAHLELTRGYSTIHRFEGERAITVSAEVDESINESVAVNRILEGRFRDISQRYPGYRLDFRGQFAEFKEAFSSLGRLFILGVFIMYMLLGAQFKSFTQPLIILFTVPFAFIGAMLGLLVNGTPFGIVTLFGMVALAGIVVNDSIVLVDFINMRRRAGVSKWRAIIEGGRLRMRPILLTTITTIVGLLPMAIGLGGQSEMWMPLANTIVWGLAMATLLTLFIIPALYAIVDDLTPRRLRVMKEEPLLGTPQVEPVSAD
jgi:multidrug efflux pump subunit AcrB